MSDAVSSTCPARRPAAASARCQAATSRPWPTAEAACRPGHVARGGLRPSVAEPERDRAGRDDADRHAGCGQARDLSRERGEQRAPGTSACVHERRRAELDDDRATHAALLQRQPGESPRLQREGQHVGGLGKSAGCAVAVAMSQKAPRASTRSVPEPVSVRTVTAAGSAAVVCGAGASIASGGSALSRTCTGGPPLLSRCVPGGASSVTSSVTSALAASVAGSSRRAGVAGGSSPIGSRLVTTPVVRSTRRSAWFPVSATIRTSPMRATAARLEEARLAAGAVAEARARRRRSS